MALLVFNAKGIQSIASYTESQRRWPWVYLYINKEREKGAETYSERHFGFYVMDTAQRILMHIMFIMFVWLEGLLKGALMQFQCDFFYFISELVIIMKLHWAGFSIKRTQQ